MFSIQGLPPVGESHQRESFVILALATSIQTI